MRTILHLLLLLTFEAKAACTLTLTSVTSPINFTSNQNPAAQSFSVTKSNKNQSCSYFVGFSKGSSSTYNRTMTNGSYTIDYNIRKTNTITDPVLKDYPDTTSTAEVFTGSFTGGSSTTTSFSYYPDSESWSSSNNLRFGLHTDTVVVSVYEGAFPPPASPALTAEATANIVFNYTVPRNALISLLNVNQDYTDPAVGTKTLIFPSMTQGQTVSFDMVLIYNAGYSVKFNSTNGQRLKHATLNSYVPYSVTMTGVASVPTLTAGTNITVLSGTGLSPSAPLGDRRTTTFTLGNVSSAFSGSYTESITVTLTSTE